MTTPLDSNLIGSTIQLTTVAPTILGNNYNPIKVDSIVSWKSAVKITGIDVIAQAAQLQNVLTGLGVSPDAKSYDYVVFTFQNGAFGVLGIPWIVASSVSVIAAFNATAVITGVQTTDVTPIRQALIAAGYPNVTVTLTPQ